MSALTNSIGDTKTPKEEATWKLYNKTETIPNKNNVRLIATGFTLIKKAALMCLVFAIDKPEDQLKFDDPFLNACFKQYIGKAGMRPHESEHLKKFPNKVYRNVYLGLMSFKIAKRFFANLVQAGIYTKEEAEYLQNLKEYTYYQTPKEETELHLEMMTKFTQQSYDEAIFIAKKIHNNATAKNAKRNLFAKHSQKITRGLDDSDAAWVLGAYLKPESTQLAIEAYSMIGANSLFHKDAQQIIADLKQKQTYEEAQQIIADEAPEQLISDLQKKQVKPR